MTDQQELLPDAPIDPLRLGTAVLDDVPADKWAQGLVQLVEVQEAAYKRLGYDDAEAFKLARAGILAIAEFHGGRGWYLPRGDDLVAALRDAEIYRRSKRGNIPALAKEYGLTDQHVWRIVRQQRKLHISKVQGDFFIEDGDV